MVSAPQQPSKLARLGTTFVVRIGDKDGNAPTDTDEFREVIPISIELGTGGRELDRASFQVDLGMTGQRIVDFQIDPKMQRQVEVYAVDENGDFVPLFWGEYDQQNMEINEEGEFVVITASVQKQHFGKPLQGPEEYNKPLDQKIINETDLVFNPEIQGLIRGNQRTDPNSTDDFLFVDPLSAWESKAKSYLGLGTVLDKWTVETAIKTIARLANENESVISNPDTYTVVNLAPELKNFKIPRGLYLNDALDQLLAPHGFTWYLEIHKDFFGNLVKQIHLMKQGVGIEKNLYLQRPGEVLDTNRSNTPELTIETNISELANRVTVFGDFIKKEVTLELKKGWTKDIQDILTPDELQKKDEAGSQFETYPNAHRKWVFNEGGNYIGLRPEFGNAPADLTFFDADQYVHKRRKTEKLLTYDKENNRRDQYLEYYDNGLATWKPVPPEWGYEILDDEIGIYFSGNKPPSELWDQGSSNINDMRLRMTCVVACDKRVSYTAERRESSSNGNDIEITIDASDRFFKKTVDSNSKFFGVFDADEKDSTTEIQTYAERLRDVNDSANVQVSVVLEGIRYSYKRGDLLKKIDGRNISLNRNSSDVSAKRYLQITGIIWDYLNQRTALINKAFKPIVRTAR